MTNESTILDRFLFRFISVLVASLYVSELGSIHSIFERLLTIEFYYEFGVTFLIAITVTELLYRINQVLSRKYPLHDHTAMRILLQIVFGLVVPAVLVFLMAALYFGINGINIFKTDYLVFVFPLVVVLLILLNLLFILVPYFVHAYRLQKEKGTFRNLDREERSSGLLNPVKVLDGASVRYINANDILLAYIIEGKVLIKCSESSELLTDHTLDELESLLPGDQFFRINRKLIARKDCCQGYRPESYGKLEIEVSPVPPVPATVSQNKAKAFKEWIGSKIPID
ncbi:LytTR family DNA-binding domain-containing protein [Sphingobacterium siyangense]|uniref:LytTR family DNA-binding domain-containing protein n=1 Tax=Sphingobacterium siyangense TaxID=459529 RepID=UPI003DA3F2B9